MVTRFFEYTLTLGAPALLSTVEGDPNSVRTALSIPGSSIRGAVAAALTPAHPRFDEIVLSGCVRFLNAYPASVVEGTSPVRAVPVPRSWRADKYAEADVFDFSAVDQVEDDRQFTPPMVSFATMHASPVGVRPCVRRDFHQARDRVRGRPTEDEGAIFVYEAIESGTAMNGVVAVSGASDVETLDRIELIRHSLKTIRLGRSRLTEYGGQAAVGGWQGAHDREDALAKRLPETITRGDCFRLFLTADAIVRHPDTGQVDPSAMDTIIKRKLPATVKARYLATSVASGFNAKWRLPVQQSPALAAGSVLVLEATGTFPRVRLDELEHLGLGERRTEGFGTVLFLPLADSRVGLVLPENLKQVARQRPAGTPPDSVKEIESRILLAAVERATEQLAAGLVERARVFPSRALLGRLRSAVRSAPDAAELALWDPMAKLRVLLNRGPEGLKSSARNHLEAFRFGRSYLDAWLTEACTSSTESLDDLANELFAGLPLEACSITGTIDSGVKRQLAFEARARLVDVALAMLSKRATRAERGSND